VRDGGCIRRVSGDQRRDGGHLRARSGPCELRCRPEGSGASRWEKTGTVVLGSENNETEASQQPVGFLRNCYGSGKGPTLLSGTQVPNYSKRY